MTDEKGKTLWKTTTLFADRDDDTWGDQSESPEKNVEYMVGAMGSTDDGMFLYDISNDQYVLKKFNGNEIRLSKEVSNYEIRYINDSEISVQFRKLIFIQFGDGTSYKLAPFELAIVDYAGKIEGICRTKIIMNNIDFISLNQSADRLLITYTDNKNTRGFLILSMDGKIVKSYPNFDPGNVIEFKEKAPDYAILRSGWASNKLILDIRNGEIVAGLNYECIDMTEINDKLIAIVGSGLSLIVMDLLNGKLLQDFSKIGNQKGNRFLKSSQ